MSRPSSIAVRTTLRFHRSLSLSFTSSSHTSSLNMIAAAIISKLVRTELIRPHGSSPPFGMAFGPGGRIDVEEAAQA